MGRVSTERAEFEIGIHGLIATSTSPGRGGIHGLTTSITCQHGHTLFNPQKRNKKQAEIMIDALIVSCLQTTAGANSGVFIECLGFRLNTGDEKHVDIAYGDWLIFLMILYIMKL